MLYRCFFVVFGIAERQLPKSCEENDLMNKRTLHRLISAFAALVIGLSVLTGCGTKTAENVEKQEDAQTTVPPQSTVQTDWRPAPGD